jgi:hypothetical protein
MNHTQRGWAARVSRVGGGGHLADRDRLALGQPREVVVVGLLPVVAVASGAARGLTARRGGSAAAAAEARRQRRRIAIFMSSSGWRLLDVS